MAVLVGKSADLYIATGSGTSMTGEAVTDLTGGVYQITNTAKRALNPNASLTVLDGVATVPPSAYEVYWGSGKIVINSHYTVSGTITVTGSYLTLSQAAQGFEWSLDSEVMLEESQTFGDSWKERTATVRSAKISFQRFWADGFFRTNIGSYYVIALYLNTSSAKRYLCAAHCSSFGVQSGENNLIRENVTFDVHGGLDYATS